MFKDFTRTIIAANPSFAVDKERLFWQHLDRLCERDGWRLFKHSARKIPEDARTMIIPARLRDASRFLGRMPSRNPPTELPVWLPRNDFDTMIAWEAIRWQLGDQTEHLPDGLTRLAWHVDYIYQKLRPAGTIVSNKIDHGTALFYLASNYYGGKTLFFERSPVDTFIVEDSGMFAESGIWDGFRRFDQQHPGLMRSRGKYLADYLSKNMEGFRPQSFEDHTKADAALAAMPRPLVFLPMDNIAWTGWAQESHWQGLKDYYRGTPNPSEAIERIARIVSDFGGTLVVKKHPSDVQDYHVAAENVSFVEAPIELLLNACDVCVTFLTKVTFVSAAIKKPTVTLAPNTAAASGATYHCDTPRNWQKTIHAALKSTTKERDAKYDRLCDLLGWLDKHYYVDPSLPVDLDKPSGRSILSRIQGSSAGLKAGLSLSSLDATISKLMERFNQKQNWTYDIGESLGRIPIFFDVSRLANTRLRHSGISRFVAAMLKQLDSMAEVELVPVLFKPEILRRGAYANDMEGFSEFIGRPVLLPPEIEKHPRVDNGVIYSPYDEFVPVQGLSIPRIATVHDVLHITASEWYLDAKARVHIDNVLGSLVPDDWVVCVSEFTRKQMLEVARVTPGRAVTVHLAADVAYRQRDQVEIASFRERHNLGAVQYFVLFGQFEFRKNVPTMLSAIRRIVDSNESRSKFVVIGSGVGIAAMKQAMSASALSTDRIAFVEAPEDDEVAVAYSGASGMLYVSLAEGFGLPVVEALACGCPVITSSVTSIPEVAGDAALYVDPSKADQIANAILRLERSESLRQSLSDRALAQARLFDWGRTACSLVQVAKDAVSANARSPVGHVGIDAAGSVTETTFIGDKLLLRMASKILLQPESGLQLLENDQAIASEIDRSLEDSDRDEQLVSHFQRVLQFARSRPSN